VPATYTIPALDPYLVSAAAFARMARAGITSIVHCQLSGPPLFDTAGAVARAARDVGVRVAFVVPLRDRARLGYGADQAILAHMAPADRDAIAARWLRPILPIAEQLDLVDRIAEQYSSPTFAVQYGPVGMEWCSDQLLGEVAIRAGRSQRRIHMHLLESRYQRQWCDHHYPNGPVTRLAELGLLSPRLTLAHGTWLRPDESEILAAHGVTISVNTSSNLRLKSGIAPVHDMKTAGLRFAVGLDALALDDDDDMLRELRLSCMPDLASRRMSAGPTCLMPPAMPAPARCAATASPASWWPARPRTSSCWIMQAWRPTSTSGSTIPLSASSPARASSTSKACIAPAVPSFAKAACSASIRRRSRKSSPHNARPPRRIS
jgi:cytosine/adenosine deaminase-related metal-dependent hydrolase